VDYQPYVGRDGTFEGQSGTRRVASGIDSNGTPPRRYRVLGVASIELGERRDRKGFVDSALVEQVKLAGGDAAILLWVSRSTAGVMPAGMMYAALHDRTDRFQVIRYLD
jgi:hypothetical protein